MKKRYIIIPLATIAFALCLAMFMTFFTTPAYSIVTGAGNVMLASTEEGETHEDYFRPAKKAGKVLQLSYKISPKYETLETLKSTYNPYFYIIGTYYKQTPPSDFLKNSVKYTKLMCETEYDEDRSASVRVPMNSPLFDMFKASEIKDYAQALYLDGQVEESEKVIEDLFAEIKEKAKGADDEQIKHLYVAFYQFRDYFYLVYSSTENVSVKKWVLDTEAAIEKEAKNSESIAKYIESHGYFFSNPDYDTYVKHPWPEEVDVEITEP